jgi:hypothetical protein
LKAKIHTLISDNKFKLIGIASHLSDYKLSWLFNEELNFKFAHSDDLIVTSSHSNVHKFSIYKYEIEGGSYFSLIANRSEMSVLIKAHKNLDYILKIEGEISDAILLELIEKIKKLKNILTAFEIFPRTLKSKELEFLQ